MRAHTQHKICFFKAVFPVVLLAVFCGIFSTASPVYASCPANIVSSGIGDEICPDLVVPLNIEALIGAGIDVPNAGGGLSTGGAPIFSTGSSTGGAAALARADYAGQKVQSSYADLVSETCPASIRNSDGSAVALTNDQKNLIKQSYVDFLVSIEFTDQVVNRTFANQAALDNTISAMIDDALAQSRDTLNDLCAGNVR